MKRKPESAVVWGGHLLYADGYHTPLPVPEGGCHSCGRTDAELFEYRLGFPIYSDCEEDYSEYGYDYLLYKSKPVGKHYSKPNGWFRRLLRWIAERSQI